jgi:hypothetical protein
MSQRFRNGSGQFAGAVMLAALFAGIVCIVTSGHANEAKLATTSVDRAHKGDRLPSQSGFDKSRTTKAPILVPAGCDPAFSPVAEPEHSRIFGRCVT